MFAANFHRTYYLTLMNAAAVFEARNILEATNKEEFFTSFNRSQLVRIQMCFGETFLSLNDNYFQLADRKSEVCVQDVMIDE